MELATARARSERRQFKIIDLLRPHRRALAIGIVAVIGEGVANLLEPWPLKALRRRRFTCPPFQQPVWRSIATRERVCPQIPEEGARDSAQAGAAQGRNSPFCD